MKRTRAKSYSLRFRLTIYLIGIALIALPWGYSLFVRPWLQARASRAPTATRSTRRRPADTM